MEGNWFPLASLGLFLFLILWSLFWCLVVEKLAYICEHFLSLICITLHSKVDYPPTHYFGEVVEKWTFFSCGFITCNVFFTSYKVLRYVACITCAPVPYCFVDIYLPAFDPPEVLWTLSCFSLSYLKSLGTSMRLIWDTLKYFPCFGLISTLDLVFPVEICSIYTPPCLILTATKNYPVLTCLMRLNLDDLPLLLNRISLLLSW